MKVRSWLICLLVASTCPLLTTPATGQILPPFEALQGGDALIQRLQRQQQQRALLPLTMEGALDAESYIVGPGDEFVVSVGGGMAQEQRPIVSADGYLVIPEVGRFEAAGKSLAEVQRMVRPHLQRLYRNVPAEIVLHHPRMFFVHVTGAVSAPGRHLVGPIPRADDAVIAAMGNKNPYTVHRDLERSNLTGLEAQMLPALRNVRVTHRNGSTSSIDLRLYYASGNSEHNPYLQDGDIVFVPSFTAHQSAVHVEGPIQSPGIFDFRPGDTVLTLLTVAAGPENLPSLGSVRLIRGEGNPSSATYSVADLLNEQVSATELRPGDRLIVHPPAPEHGSVTVEGRVTFPGTFTVRVGQTTVGHVLEMAGGLLPNALPHAAYIERRGATRPQLAGEDRTRRRMLEDLIAGSDRQPFHAEIELAIAEDAFGSLRLADLDYTSRQYLLSELRRTPRLPIDVEQIQNGSAHDVVVRDGDRIVIPEDPGGIFVFGQVERSGFVSYEPGLSPEGYVERAGGRTSGATEAFVRRAGTGLIVPAASAGDVQRGDEIFVDRRPMADTDARHQIGLQERSIRVQQRQQWIHIGSIVVSTMTAILTTFMLTR